VTDDENPPKRPNANYNLSKPDNENDIKEEQLVFHYNRDRRLEKAPQNVRDIYYAESPKRGRFSVFGSLVATKPRASLFLSIIILCAVIMIISLLGIFDSTHLLDGNTIEITGTRYEGATIVVLTKTNKKGDDSAYYGAVDIVISPVTNGDDDDFPVFYHRIFFSLEEIEEYRFVVPFDTPEQTAFIKTEINFIRISFKPL
jgi:hypothetical protein